MPDPITIVPSADDPTVWALAGELDLDTAPKLARAVLEWLQQSAGSRLRLSCEELRFIDSAGISALVQVARTAAEQGIELKVIKPSARMQKLLRLTGVDAVLVDDTP